jgi:predicted acylesterase/phospholipase RssA
MTNGSTSPLPIALVLSGTAPAMTLMSGAMIAFAERGLRFEVISTTGVGALIGMMYLAPRGGTAEHALRQLPNLFVSDWLYALVPVNFKVFSKNGPLARRAWELRRAVPEIPVEPHESRPVTRFVNDWMDLWASALTPASRDSTRKGLMGHVPLVEDLVDFDVLKASPTRFYVNAFSLFRRKLRIFDNRRAHDPHGIDPDVYNAAQALFALFEPVRIPGDLLTTGATHDSTALQAIWTHERGPHLRRVLALDFVPRAFWRKPENVYDAFQLMIMSPIAAAHEPMLALYDGIAKQVNALPSPVQREALGGELPPLSFVPMDVKESYYPSMLKWTHDNACKLQKIGYEAAKPVAAILHQAATGTSDEQTAAFRRLAAEYGYPPARRVERVRTDQFLRLFSPLLDPEHFRRFVDHVVGGTGTGTGTGTATVTGAGA